MWNGATSHNNAFLPINIFQRITFRYYLILYADEISKILLAYDKITNYHIRIETFGHFQPFKRQDSNHSKRNFVRRCQTVKIVGIFQPLETK